MAKISSNWKLTFDPGGSNTVLLDYGEWMEGELRFPMTKGLEVERIVEADDFLRPTGGTAFTIAFEVYKDYSTDALARQQVMTSLISIGNKSRKELKLQIYGITDRHWIFANAYITSHNPGRILEAPVARMVKGFTAVAVGLSQVGP